MASCLWIGFAVDFPINFPSSLTEVKEQDRSFWDGIRFSLCHSRPSTVWESSFTPEFLPTLWQTRLILLTHLVDCRWKLNHKNGCKMYSPHKKCYESYEILMGSVRWVVIGRFKREGKKNGRSRSNTGSLKTFRQAKISQNKRGVPGWGWGCHKQETWEIPKSQKLGSCKQAIGINASKRIKSTNHTQTQTEPS